MGTYKQLTEWVIQHVQKNQELSQPPISDASALSVLGWTNF